MERGILEAYLALAKRQLGALHAPVLACVNGPRAFTLAGSMHGAVTATRSQITHPDKRFYPTGKRNPGAQITSRVR